MYLDKFAPYRNEAREINLIDALKGMYGVETISLKGLEYARAIMEMQPIISRQIASLVIVNARMM